MWGYFDSSAVVKLYVQERGRTAVLRLLRQHEVVASAILPIEIRGALRRRADENVIGRSRLPAALKQLALDRTQWNLLSVSTEILERTEQIVASHSVRTLDAIHIASAQEFAGQLRARIPFISADHRQIEAAVALGLIVERVA
ncbi:MAG TPA: type II toxin-antitoxin system VapC family toxin [Candidatus Sulfotelmatobacter sp.]|nr:type II toxin-antitoxin system VapC family toxin [Candidatus Sulfotelmatobacter sp.]